MNKKNLNENEMMFRGRIFSQKDLVTIKNIVSEHFDKGRTYISQSICEELNWKQPNGWLKDRACRDVLIKLEKEGLVILPEPKVKLREQKTEDNKIKSKKVSETQPPQIITEFPNQLEFELAKGNKAEKVWNELVKKHHYLGHKVIVGRCLKYIIKNDAGEILSAIAFSSPAWHLETRDDFLKKLEIKSENLRDLVINNSRFLILPHIQIPNLASTILSASVRKVKIDWLAYYSIQPKIVETFVQPSRYNGTCYKAANWVEIGITKGYAKNGASYHNSQEPKQIFLYGLNKQLRKKMLGIIKIEENK